jgi:arylsulfatase A-like enzyme
MYGAWDAPLELQEELLAPEEGDPPPRIEVEPPDLMAGKDTEPDAIFRCATAYAAQAMLLDASLEGLLASIEPGGREDWTILLLGVRGYPLGEHGRIGGVDGRLFAEQLHVPMIWRFADAQHRLSRSGKLISLADVPTMIEGLADQRLVIPQHEALHAAGPHGARAIRTASWCLRSDGHFGERVAGRSNELYVRPDDRWEANDVADLCPREVEELLARLAAVPAG